MFYVGGTAGLRNMGTYAAGTTYFPNDMVQYSGSTYVATATTTGNLPTNGTYWSVLAAAGASGASSTINTLMVPTFTTGLWYSRRSMTTAAVNGGVASISTPISTFGLVPGYVSYVSYFAHRALVVDQAAVITSSTAPSAGASLQVALYANSAINQPAARIGASMSVSPTASLTAYSSAVSWTIPAGWSWFGVAVGSSYTAGNLLGYTAHEYLPQIGWTDLSTPSLISSQQGGRLYYELNSSAPVTATPTLFTASLGSTVDVFFRVAG